jgi:hypothetical protein
VGRDTSCVIGGSLLFVEIWKVPKK